MGESKVLSVPERTRVSGRVTFQREDRRQKTGDRESTSKTTMMMTYATTAANAILSATVLVALIAAPLARAEPDAPTTPIVSTTAGKVQGELIDFIYTFKGIPYAADTGGANRWTAPKIPEPWSDVRNATTFMDWCPQKVSNGTS